MTEGHASVEGMCQGVTLTREVITVIARCLHCSPQFIVCIRGYGRQKTYPWRVLRRVTQVSIIVRR